MIFLLLCVTGYSGNAGDSLWIHNDNKFSTVEQDNDKSSGEHCVLNHGRGGWWFNACDDACLTGTYFGAGVITNAGIEWYKAYSDHRSFKTAEMKIKPL